MLKLAINIIWHTSSVWFGCVQSIRLMKISRWQARFKTATIYLLIANAMAISHSIALAHTKYRTPLSTIPWYYLLSLWTSKTINMKSLMCSSNNTLMHRILLNSNKDTHNIFLISCSIYLHFVFPNFFLSWLYDITFVYGKPTGDKFV